MKAEQYQYYLQSVEAQARNYLGFIIILSGILCTLLVNYYEGIDVKKELKEHGTNFRWAVTSSNGLVNSILANDLVSDSDFVDSCFIEYRLKTMETVYYEIKSCQDNLIPYVKYHDDLFRESDPLADEIQDVKELYVALNRILKLLESADDLRVFAGIESGEINAVLGFNTQEGSHVMPPIQIGTFEMTKFGLPFIGLILPFLYYLFLSLVRQVTSHDNFLEGFQSASLFYQSGKWVGTIYYSIILSAPLLFLNALIYTVSTGNIDAITKVSPIIEVGKQSNAELYYVMLLYCLATVGGVLSLATALRIVRLHAISFRKKV